MKPKQIFNNKVKKFKLNSEEINELWKIIEPICNHKEFIKRCNKPFYHHDTITLGEHIISDTIVAYKYALKKPKANLKIVCLIAMFHDLYEIPWQNVHDHKRLMNKHGFVHPIEAAINAITWYPDVFKNTSDALIIVDGIIHHMFPLPVRAINGTELNLNNIKTFQSLEEVYQKMIIDSSKRKSIGKIGFCKSKYLEGRIVSKADKKVALGMDLKNIRAYLSLINGNNKKIKK